MNKVLIVIVVLIIASCGRRVGSERDLAIIQDVLNGQTAAWNKGDIDGYMKGYWMSDSLIFTGSKSMTKGWEPALNRYKVGYPNQDAMGQLQFSEVETNFTSQNSAYSVGIWTLNRVSDTLTGRFTLVWARKNGAWFIVADHSS